MKKHLFILLLLVFSTSAFTEECKLNEPIPVTDDFTLHQVTFSPAVFDQIPQFLEPNSYDPKKESLSVNLFPVQNRFVNTGFISGNIKSANDSLGAANDYEGMIHMSGTTEEKGNLTVYTFQEVSYFDGNFEEGRHRHAAGEAITESKITVSEGKIIAFQLKIPLFTIWKRTDNGRIRHTAFTGKHQILCLKNGM